VPKAKFLNLKICSIIILETINKFVSLSSEDSERLQLLVYKATLNQSGLPEYSFRFQHRNPRAFPIESFALDSGRSSVRVEYGYPKGSPKKKSAATALNTGPATVHTQTA
jgi:hypothetical protein